MVDYTIRIELLGNPSYAEYEKLHALMSSLGFFKSVSGVAADGTQRTFSLPHATYFGSSYSDCPTVRDLIRARVKAEIQPGIVIFVAATSTWAIG